MLDRCNTLWVRTPLGARIYVCMYVCMYVCSRLFLSYSILCRYRPCDTLISYPKSLTKYQRQFIVSEINCASEEVRGPNKNKLPPQKFL
jgi:hypothetical protein